MVNKLKKALALVLAAAMVVTVAPVNTAEAAAKYSITKRTSVEAEKTYTYTIKGVKKGQYVKVNAAKGVVVKYGKKTVKKAAKAKGTVKIKGTGKALKIKVTAADNVANYNNKLVAKVYNKKTNKVVKTLKAKGTVKVQELKVLTVASSATGGQYKYLTATFNKSVKGVTAGDVMITNKTTGALHSVESVVVSSNGKSMNVVLLGDTSQSGGTTFLQPNVDYLFQVTSNGVTASMDFTIDATAEEATIINIDSQKKTITLDKTPGKVTVPDAIGLDYEEVLGRTATVWYNKSNEITKIVLNDEKVIYGGFQGTEDTSGKYLTDALTNEKYFVQEASTPAVNGNVTIKGTRMIPRDDKGTVTPGAVSTAAANTFAGVNGQVWSYGKLVLNSNGTVKTFVSERWDDSVLVDKVDGNIVSAGTKYEVNLKDYVIVKGGKTIKISDIAAGDVVFYNVKHKFAEVFNAGVSGKITAVYAGKFDWNNMSVAWKFDDPGKRAYVSYQMRYIKATEGLANADDDYIEKLFKKGGDVTIYSSRLKQPLFIAGETGEVASDKVTLVMTANAQTYSSELKNILRLKGFNGTEIKTYDVNLADLTEVVAENGNIYRVNKGISNDGGTNWTGTVKGFGKFTGTTWAAEDATTSDLDYTSNGTTSAGTVITDVNEKTLPADGNGIAKRDLVELTVDKDGKVTALNARNAVVDATGATLGADLEKGASVVKLGGNSYQLTKTTPMYIYDEVNDKVTKSTFGDFNGKIASTSVAATGTAATEARFYCYSSDAAKKNTDALVVSKKLIGAGNGVTLKGVVSKASYTTGSSPKLNKLEVLVGSEMMTFTTFAQDLSTTYYTGQTVYILASEDKKTVQDVSVDAAGATLEPSYPLSATCAAIATAGSINGDLVIGAQASGFTTYTLRSINTNDKSFNLVATNGTADKHALATDATVTIAQIDNSTPTNPVVKPLTYSELISAADDYYVYADALAGSGYYVDTIVVGFTKVEGHGTTYDTALATLTGLTATDGMYNGITSVAAFAGLATAISTDTAAETYIKDSIAAQIKSKSGLSSANVTFGTTTWSPAAGALTAGDTLATTSVTVTVPGVGNTTINPNQTITFTP